MITIYLLTIFNICYYSKRINRRYFKFKFSKYFAYFKILGNFTKFLIMGKWVPFCCTLGGGVDLGLGIYDLYFLNNNKYQKSFEAKPLFNAVLKIYGEPCTKFSKLSYKRKKFYDFSTSKLLANFRVFDRFPTIKTTHKEPCIKFSKLFGHPKIFYRHFKKNFSKQSKISMIPLTITFGENFKSLKDKPHFLPINNTFILKKELTTYHIFP
ncbi:hypothetical protein AGLY_016019 [Aphis glycines]|uniref:Uncharacterized protein n=1 Tax=Aphis glycines TaxID=307491 RepID=A0A6G0T0N6_APHGL|nr:hypothetical protein AGLY_016019 [Aphis glycines]